MITRMICAYMFNIKESSTLANQKRTNQLQCCRIIHTTYASLIHLNHPGARASPALYAPRRVQEMTEAFLNTPLGAQDDSMRAYLRQKDPDAMMLNLGMTLSGDHEAITSGDNLSLSSGGQPPPPLPPQALLHEGEEQAAAAAAAASGSSGGPAGVTTRDSTAPRPSPGGVTLPPASSPLALPPRQAAGMYGSPSPADILPSPLSAMMAANGGGEAGAAVGGLGSGVVAAAAKDFTFLVRALGAHGRFEEARARVMPEMRRRGIVPADSTFVALLAGAAVDRNPDAAEEVRKRKYVQLVITLHAA